MSVFATVGSGPGGNGQNVARMFIRLKDWSERDSKTGTSFAISSVQRRRLTRLKKLALSPAARQQLAVLVVLAVLIWKLRTTLERVTMR